jgi:hypothetical protein
MSEMQFSTAVVISSTTDFHRNLYSDFDVTRREWRHTETFGLTITVQNFFEFCSLLAVWPAEEKQ